MNLKKKNKSPFYIDSTTVIEFILNIITGERKNIRGKKSYRG